MSVGFFVRLVLLVACCAAVWCGLPVVKQRSPEAWAQIVQAADAVESAVSRIKFPASSPRATSGGEEGEYGEIPPQGKGGTSDGGYAGGASRRSVSPAEAAAAKREYEQAKAEFDSLQMQADLITKKVRWSNTHELPGGMKERGELLRQADEMRVKQAAARRRLTEAREKAEEAGVDVR